MNNKVARLDLQRLLLMHAVLSFADWLLGAMLTLRKLISTFYTVAVECRRWVVMEC